MHISRMLFIACFPTMIMASWIHNSTRQPPGVHYITLKEARNNYSTQHTLRIVNSRNFCNPYLFLPIVEDPVVLRRVPHKLPLQKGYVEYRGIVVYKLEQVYFEREAVVKLCLGTKKLQFRQSHRQPIVKLQR